MTKELTSHHDGYGLTESIKVAATDEIGPGGAYHSYGFWIRSETNEEKEVGYIQFQNGPRNEEGSIPGVVESAVLGMLIDRLEHFQAGPYDCGENAEALACLNVAMYWFKKRVKNRAERGVLGRNLA